MTPIRLDTFGPAVPAMPLALIFNSRLLLTEKSMGLGKPISSTFRLETHLLRASTVTTILKDIQGYNHYGIND
jgi:hypothetical protein